MPQSEDVLARDFEAVLRRLMQAAEAESETGLGRALGIRQPSVAAARRRGRIPAGWVAAIAQDYGVSADWLLFGQGGVRRGASEAGGVVALPLVKPRLDPASGRPQLAAGPAPALFSRKFLEDLGDPVAMLLLPVYGEAMSPDIQDGDLTLVDTSQTEVLPGRVYAAAMDAEIVVRQVDKAPGRLLLLPRNVSCLPIEMPVANLPPTFRLVGRVLWWSRTAR